MPLLDGRREKGENDRWKTAIARKLLAPSRGSAPFSLAHSPEVAVDTSEHPSIREYPRESIDLFAR